jgi:hypothetical protein
VAYGITQLVHIRKTRTLTAYLAQWGMTTPTRGLFYFELQKKEPASLIDYRYLVMHARGSMAVAAANRMSKISTIGEDTVLLKAAARRLASNEGESKAINVALDTLRVRLSHLESPKSIGE